MEIVRGIEKLAPGRRRAVTIGFFDGVHLGHRKVIEKAVAEANRLGVESLVMTFDPHPLEIIKPGFTLETIIDLETKARLVAQAGAEQLLIARFDEKLGQMAPASFCEEIVLKALGAAALVVGENFRFGQGRRGDIGFLREFLSARDVRVVGVPPVTVEGASVSSTAVRRFILAGEIEAARSMLGRRPAVKGEVVPGRREGRSLGFGTANVKPVPKLIIPAKGVYAGYVLLDDERRPSAIYIGTSPTFGVNELRVEVHVFGVDEDLYGRQVEVEFEAKIRDERKFAGRHELVAQIKQDVARARSLLRAAS